VSWLQFADGIAPARTLEINTLSMVLLLPVMFAMARSATASTASRCCWPRRRWLS